MDSTKYIGMDVHKESDLDRGPEFCRQGGDGMRHRNQGQHHSAVYPRASGRPARHFEEGTWAAWLYDLLKPHVTELVVCNPRKNALLKEGSKSDRIDATQTGRTVAHERSVRCTTEKWPAHVEGIVP